MVPDDSRSHSGRPEKIPVGQDDVWIRLPGNKYASFDVKQAMLQDAPVSKVPDEPQLRRFRLRLSFAGVPAGTFTMGSPSHEEGRYVDEPQVSVTISKSFLMGKRPVTQGDWKAVMGTKPWAGQQYVQEGDDFPAVYISWDDAMRFCEKLTRVVDDPASRRRKVFRLPTEAEWEYACRAGTTTAYSFGDDPNDLHEYGWFAGNAGHDKHPHETSQKKPNRLGLYDMHGNIWEWCLDFYGPLKGGTDPTGPANRSIPELEDLGSLRVFRGGCWLVDQHMCRSANRDCHAPETRAHCLGFRVVLSDLH